MGRDLLLFAALERLDQVGFVPGNVLADKDQRGGLHRKRFEIPASGDVIEQIGPLWETDEALGPHDCRAQAFDKRLKTLPCQSRRGDVAEGLYAELVTMLWRADLVCAREAKQHIRVHLTALRGENQRILIELPQPCTDLGQLLGRHQIDLVQQNDIGRFDLHTPRLPQTRIAHNGVGVGYRHHAIQPHLWHVLLDIEDQGVGLGHTGGFSDDEVGVHRVDELGHRHLEFAQQRAADAPTPEVGDADVFAFDDLTIDGDLAEFIHQDRDLLRYHLQDVAHQRGLATPQGTRDQGDGCAWFHGNYPFTLPTGVKRTTRLLMPARSTASMTSSISL